MRLFTFQCLNIPETLSAIVLYMRSHPIGNTSIERQHSTDIRISSPFNRRRDGLLKVAPCRKLASISMMTVRPLFSMTRIRNASLSG